MTQKADAPKVARRMTLQIATPEIQGADSWVEVIPFTVEERFNIPPGMSKTDLIKERVIGWNWVDKDGEALAQPDGSDAMTNALTTFELTALFDVVIGFPGVDDLKN